MGTLGLSGRALGMVLAIAFIAGCGRIQGGGPGALPMSSAMTARAKAPGRSWMLPSAKNTDLLYVSNNEFNGELLVFSFPAGELIGEVTIPSPYPGGLCSDSSGNIFVTTLGSPSQSYIYEYAHGGTNPIATLSNPGEANGCALDPTTGNLAVTNVAGEPSGASVEIYERAQGMPTAYVDPQISAYAYCTYDDNGNLYVDALHSGLSAIIGELPAGSATFTNVTLTKGIGPIAMQWRNGSIVTSGFTNSQFGKQPIYTIHVIGSVGTVSGPVLLWSRRNRNAFEAVQFSIRKGVLVEPGRGRGNVLSLLNFWDYPAGGKPKKIIRRPNGDLFLYGVAFSVVRDTHDRPRLPAGDLMAGSGALR